MLNAIRKNADSIWVKGGLCLVASTFLFFFGMSDVINKITGNDYIIKVGDVKIGPNLFKFETRKAAEKLKKAGITDDGQIINIVVHQLINDEITKQMLDGYGFFVSDDLVKMYMYSIPMFRAKDGALNRGAIRQFMQQMEMREGEFVDFLQKNIRDNLIMTVLSTLRPNVISANYVSAILENRDVRSVFIPYNTFNIAEKYTDDDLEECYKANADSFMLKETRDFSVVMIEEESISRDISISEDDVKAEYKARSEEADFEKVRDEIHASLVANEIERRLNEKIRLVEDDFAAGVALEDIVKKHGLKKTEFKGIAEDYVSPPNSSTSLPFMEQVMKAAFGLELGQESSFLEGLDRSNKKVHWIVKNESITPAHPKPFAEVKGEVIKKWEAMKQQELALSHVRGLVDQINSGVAIDFIAEKNGYKVSEIKGISRVDVISDKKYADVKYMNEAFKLRCFDVPSLHSEMVSTDEGLILFQVISVYSPKDIKSEDVSKANAAFRKGYASELLLQLKQYKMKKLGVKTNLKLLKSAGEYMPDVDF